MNAVVKTILTAISASGVMTLIITLIVTKLVNKQFSRNDKREELRDQNQLIMMARIDKLSKTTTLMAKKLHDAGIINGDLEELQKEYKDLDDKYENNIRLLAHEILYNK